MVRKTIKSIYVHGNQASLIGQSFVTASIWGSPISVWPLQIQMFFEKNDNHSWQIVKQVASTF